VIAAASADDAIVSIGQLSIPVERGGRPDDLDALMRLAETVRGAVNGCDDVARVARELNAPEPPRPARVRIGDLASNIRAQVAPLKVGETTAPIRTDVGALVLMVCTREEAPSNLPSREDIADNLTRQRLDLMARRYLRDLRRAAFIDIRA
jgi:peptidyl-prolyl cis-trans isomerase SurA